MKVKFIHIAMLLAFMVLGLGIPARAIHALMRVVAFQADKEVAPTE